MSEWKPQSGAAQRHDRATTSMLRFAPMDIFRESNMPGRPVSFTRLQNEKWQAGEGRSAKVSPPPSPLIGLLAVPMKGAGVGEERDLLPPPSALA